MNDTTAQADFDDIEFYRDPDDPTTVYYLPKTPGPETAPNGKPTLILWASDKGGRLQLGSQWRADTETLDSLRELLAQRFQLKPAAIKFSPLPVTVEGVTLEIGDGGGRFETLQTATSSGFPPYTALFNVPLTAEQKARAMNALTGSRKYLQISYQGRRLVDVTAETSIEGDIQADIEAVGRAPSLADCRTRIDRAISSGRLRVRRQASPDAPTELKTRADALAKDKAASLLEEKAKNAPRFHLGLRQETTMKAVATLHDKLPIAFKRSSDVSTWFPRGDGRKHITVVPGTLPSGPQPTQPGGPQPMPGTPEPSPGPETGETVKLGFEARELPIAFIQLTRGGAKTTLRPPTFDAVRLPNDNTGQPLVVKTNYTKGGPAYETRLTQSSDEGWVLTPADVGLVHVTVDGTDRQAHGAREVRLRVRYQATSKGTPDERTITLQGDDWTVGWYVITRSATLDGTLEYEWREISAQGVDAAYPFGRTEEPAIRL